MMDQFQAKFIEEANDLIATLEKTLLALEQQTDDKSLIEKIFRVMHTLKGNSSMFGFEKMGAVTHDLETIYDFVREGKRPVTRELLNITFTSLDHFKVLLADPQLSDESALMAHRQLMEQIKAMISQKPEEHTSQQISEPVKSTPDSIHANTFHIIFKPGQHILQNGTNPLYLVEELYSLGTCQVVPHLEQIPDLSNFDFSTCYTYWDIYLTTQADEKAIKDVFIFVEEECEIHIVRQEDSLMHKAKDLIQEIVEQGAVSTKPAEVSAELLKKSQANTPDTLKEQLVSSIRVPSEKLDDLMNLVSELVTTQARLSLFAEQNALPELISIAENVEKISRQLRDNTFSICLVPLENIITRFQRLVRDLSAELKKDIILVTEGADTELDKSVIESLADPLLHILRNSIDHGIEDEALRLQKGKPKRGKILLKAFYSGTNVHIQIQDDGAGINSRKIREKAIQKGLISAEAVLSEKEILDLIFLPGFSTAEKVTDVSGRGVGMDVVRRKIADLRGEVQLQSKVDAGTIITIKLPLTLSIIDGLLVRIDDTHFVIPLSVVDKCYEADHHQLVSTFNNLIILDNEKVPFFYLRKEFDIIKNTPAIEQVVVIYYEGNRVGLTVDAVIGEYQAVLKPLGRCYKNQEYMSGATILGDGTIALVMDTSKIIKQFLKSETITQ